MENLIGYPNIQVAMGHFPLVPNSLSVGPVHGIGGGSINSTKQAETVSYSSNTNVPAEPSWLEDLLNEPETPPVNEGHRRSASDPFSGIGGNSGGEELWLGNAMGGPTWGLHPPEAINGRAPLARKLGVISQEQVNDWKSSSTTTTKTNTVTSSKETQGGVSSSTGSESSSGGSSVSQPPLPKTDVKQKQNNARRSRARKLQYIAELERNVQALQLEGAAVTAQLEFLDHQNLLLAMENRALKQRLESISQEHVIKSMEQEMLDRELGRLQYLYHLQNLSPHQNQRQRQKQKAAAHRRGRSCDLDAQFLALSLRTAESIPGTKGSP